MTYRDEEAPRGLEDASERAREREGGRDRVIEAPNPSDRED